MSAAPGTIERARNDALYDKVAMFNAAVTEWAKVAGVDVKQYQFAVWEHFARDVLQPSWSGAPQLRNVAKVLIDQANDETVTTTGADMLKALIEYRDA